MAAPPHVESYYAATANDTRERPALAGEVRADVCVIGGGFTGLSAALHLAEAGTAVTLLEAVEPGYGASGRNGGHFIPGWKVEPEEIVKRFGPARRCQRPPAGERRGNRNGRVARGSERSGFAVLGRSTRGLWLLLRRVAGNEQPPTARQRAGRWAFGGSVEHVLFDPRKLCKVRHWGFPRKWQHVGRPTCLHGFAGDQ